MGRSLHLEIIKESGLNFDFDFLGYVPEFELRIDPVFEYGETSLPSEIPLLSLKTFFSKFVLLSFEECFINNVRTECCFF